MKSVRPFHTLLSAAWKDIQVILKDTGLLIVIIGLPMVFAMLNGLMNQNLASDNLSLPVAVVNADEGAFGTQMQAILKDIDVLAVLDLEDRETAEKNVRESEVVAAVILPEDFSKKLSSHEPTTIEVIQDTTQKSLAGIVPGILSEVTTPLVVQSEIQFAIQTLLNGSEIYQSMDVPTQSGLAAQSVAVQMAQVQKMMSDPWVKLESETTLGEDVVILPTNIFALLVPSFTVLFAFFIVGAISAELLKERREGSLRRLIAAPMPKWTIIAGKMLAYLVLVAAQVLIIFGVAGIIFKMPFQGSAIGFILVTLAMGLAATGLGMFIAAISKTDKQADGIGLILGFALGALGGCFVFGTPVPLYKTGGILGTLSRLTPQAHALTGFDLLLVQNASVIEVLPEVGILLGFAILFLLLATWRFKYEQ